MGCHGKGGAGGPERKQSNRGILALDEKQIPQGARLCDRGLRSIGSTVEYVADERKGRKP